MTVVRWSFAGLGYLGGADHYTREFASRDAARECQERVLEGREEARWTVRTDSGVMRRLGAATGSQLFDVVERRPAAATGALARMIEGARRSA